MLRNRWRTNGEGVMPELIVDLRGHGVFPARGFACNRFCEVLCQMFTGIAGFFWKLLCSK
jgi:hypothetical protein